MFSSIAFPQDASALASARAPAGDRSAQVRRDLPVAPPSSPLSGALVVYVLFAALAASAWGCGGDSKPKKRPPGLSAGAGGPAAEATDEGAKVQGNYIVLGENPRWPSIRDIFNRYRERKIEGIENPMLSALVDHIERPVIDKQHEKVKVIATTVEWEQDRPEDSDPRTWVALHRFKLIIIMTGIARPKAVVLSPNGTRYVVERGDPLGREGGRVKAILQYKILIAVPKETEPRVMSIEPPLNKLGEEVGPKRDF